MDKSFEHPGGKLRRLGPNTCSEKELLAIILHTGTNKRSVENIADNILNKFGGLNNLMGKKIIELMDIEGIGEVKATQIAAIFELTKRIIKNLETA